MNGKGVLYRLHICKVMELNPTRLFLVQKKKKRNGFERLFLDLTSVSATEKVLFFWRCISGFYPLHSPDSFSAGNKGSFWCYQLWI